MISSENKIIGNEMMFDKWKDIIVHDDSNIKGFFCQYRWLSNFYSCPVYYEGIGYNSSECAYQSAKLYPVYREYMRKLSAKDSKTAWKTFGENAILDDTPEEWNSRKYDVMSIILMDKFYRNVKLRDLLISTGDKYLEEKNWWSDSDWGVDSETGIGKNNLGKILMKVREFWKT